MKYLVVALSGSSDRPEAELGERTPFELAKIPNLTYLAKIGRVGQVRLAADRFEPSADVTFLNLLGYQADKVYTGQGPAEAANLDLQLEANEIPFRMNFITEADGRLADPTAGRLSTKEAKALINFLNKKVASDFVRFFAQNEYRHVAVLKDSHGYEALSARTYFPEAIVGEKIEQHLPKGPGDELLKKLMFDARLLLQDHEINQVRVDLHENPANMIWLWGQGRPMVLEKLQERYGLSGALVASREHIKGIGRLAGMTIIEAQGATGDLETDYDKKGRVLLSALEDKDFACLQVNACDEASRIGDAKAKIAAIEAADYFILSKVKKYLEENRDSRVLVTSCHTFPWKTQTAVKDAVPFVVAGKNITPDDVEEFSETSAKASEVKLRDGAELMQLFLSNK